MSESFQKVWGESKRFNVRKNISNNSYQGAIPIHHELYLRVGLRSKGFFTDGVQERNEKSCVVVVKFFLIIQDRMIKFFANDLLKLSLVIRPISK